MKNRPFDPETAWAEARHPKSIKHDEVLGRSVREIIVRSPTGRATNLSVLLPNHQPDEMSAVLRAMAPSNGSSPAMAMIDSAAVTAAATVVVDTTAAVAQTEIEANQPGELPSPASRIPRYFGALAGTLTGGSPKVSPKSVLASPPSAPEVKVTDSPATTNDVSDGSAIVSESPLICEQQQLMAALPAAEGRAPSLDDMSGGMEAAGQAL